MNLKKNQHQQHTTRNYRKYVWESFTHLVPQPTLTAQWQVQDPIHHQLTAYYPGFCQQTQSIVSGRLLAGRNSSPASSDSPWAILLSSEVSRFTDEWRDRIQSTPRRVGWGCGPGPSVHSSRMDQVIKRRAWRKYIKQTFYFIFVLCFMDAKEWRHLFIQAKWLLTLQHLLFEIFSNNLSTFQNECFMVSFPYCYYWKFVWFLMCRKSAVRCMKIST